MTKPDAWKKLGISQEVLNAAQDVRDSASNAKSEEYWDKVVKFLSDLSNKRYVELNRKQRNWARTIKLDLQQKHGWVFK